MAIKKPGRGVDRKGRSKRGGKFVRLGTGLLTSEAWRALSGSAIKYYVELRRQFNGTNNGDLHLSLHEAHKRLGMAKDTTLRAQQEHGLTRRLVQFALEDPEPLLYHDEPIWRDGELVGRITSGAFGHTLGRSLGMGYVTCARGVSTEYIESGTYEIEIACRRYPAEVSLRPFYDPGRHR